MPTTVFGRQAGELAVGVAATRTGNAVKVVVTVLGQDGRGQRNLEVAVANGAAWVVAPRCGIGRFCGKLSVAGAVPDVSIRLARPSGRASTVGVTLPAHPDFERAAELVRAAGAAVRGLQSLIIQERLWSGAGGGLLVTQFNYVAPDRLSYQTSRAGEAIVIGSHRWDRESGSTLWQKSAQEPLNVPAADWRLARNASVLGTGIRDGRAVWRVSFYDPTVPAWFDAELDKKTGLPLWLRMVAAAHFMTHTFGAFNAPLSILPPE